MASDVDVLVNDEPGVMMPGDCFTIEVRLQVIYSFPGQILNHLSIALLNSRIESTRLVFP
jgi:hypothetical protein